MKTRIVDVKLKSNGAYWQAWWYDATGRIRVKGLGAKAKVSKRQATALCRQLMGEMVDNPGRREQLSAPRLGDYLERYLERRTDVAEGTLALHFGTVGYLIGKVADKATGAREPGHFNPAGRIDRITRAQAADWRAHLAEQELSEATICGHVRNAKTMFKRAVDEDLIPFNPFDRLKGNAPAPDKDWHYVTLEELEKLLNACPNASWRLLLALCRLAGLRQGEALRLAWTDIDWEKRRLRVRNSKGVRTSKDKTRLVPIVDKLHGMLKAWYMDPETSGVTVIDKAHVSKSNIFRDAWVIIERAELKPWAKWCHTLRKNRETDWAQDYPSYVVAEWMGHDISVAQKHYLAVPEELFDRAALAVLAQPLAQPEGQSAKSKEKQANSAK